MSNSITGTNFNIANYKPLLNSDPTFALYQRFSQGINPYAIYNVQDRLLNVVYRAWTSGGLAALQDRNGASLPADVRARLNLTYGPATAAEASFQYEKQTNMLSQSFWAMTAVMGIGYSINQAGFGAVKKDGTSDTTKVALAALGLTRQIIVAGVETMLFIGNAYRWSDSMKPQQTVTPLTSANINKATYQAKIKLTRSEIGTFASFAMTCNAIIGLGIAAKSLDLARQGDDKSQIIIQGFNVAAAASNVVANAFKGFSNLGSVRGWSPAINRNLGIIGTGFGIINGAANIAALGSMLENPNLTGEQRGAIIAELSLQSVGTVTQAISNIILAINAANGIKAGIGIVGPALGAAAGAILVALSPLQIYGLIKQSEYADRLEELGNEILRYGYGGDTLLANLYDDKTGLEATITAATTALAIIGTAVSLAAAVSIVGAPIAVITTLAVAAISGILQGIQQPLLEAIAKNFAEKITQQGGSLIYFGKSLDATYLQMLQKSSTVNYIEDLQQSYGVDSVIGITTSKISNTALELAAITYNAAELKTSKTYIDRFIDGKVSADETLNIDPVSGRIDLGLGNINKKQLLTFITPLMAPGEEKRVRVQTGKNTYFTSLEILSDTKKWIIADGASSSTIDLRGVVTVLKKVNNSIQFQVETEVNAGKGDDTIIANTSKLTIDGGAGTDTVSYAALGPNASISVVLSDTGFTVTKTIYKYFVYQESIETQRYEYGKRTETVSYREVKQVEVKTRDDIDDNLTNIENIFGTGRADVIIGNSHSNILGGNGGDDYLNGAAGDDVIMGGSGSDRLIGGIGNDVILQDITFTSDHIDGGDGSDTIDYSTTVLDSNRELEGNVGIKVDLSKFFVEKYYKHNNDGQDYFGNIENITGTNINDTIIGDKNNNILAGGSGADYINGMGGDDVLFGGLDDDYLNGEEGDDVFLISVNSGNDTIIGGKGQDTIDYGVGNIDQGYVVFKKNYDLLQIVKSNDWNFTFEADLISGEAYTFDLNTFAKPYVYPFIVSGANNGYIPKLQLSVDGVRIAPTAELIPNNTQNKLTFEFTAQGTKRSLVKISLYDQSENHTDLVLYFRNNVFGVDNYILKKNLNETPIQLPTGNGIQVDLSWGTAIKVLDSTTYTDAITGIENVVGTSLNDLILGDNFANVLFAGAGNDEVNGGDGDDVLSGGIGDDTITGGKGNDIILQDIESSIDTLSGGEGIDTLDYSGSQFTTSEILLETFDSGIKNWKSDYKYKEDNSVGYTVNVMNVAPDWGFKTRYGKDGGSDSFLVVTGGTSYSAGFWKKEVTLIKGEKYRLTFDVNSTGVNAASIALFAGFQYVSAVDAGASLGWVNKVFEFTAATSGLQILKLTDNNTEERGNDFAIDNISLKQFETSSGIDLNLDYQYVYKNLSDSSKGVDLIRGFENVTGSARNDIIRGNALDNIIEGGAGNDTITGLAGADALSGGAGDDNISSGDDDDIVSGGIGTDIINTGNGNDLIIQNIEGVNETIDGGDGVDTIDYSSTILTITPKEIDYFDYVKSIWTTNYTKIDKDDSYANSNRSGTLIITSSVPGWMENLIIADVDAIAVAKNNFVTVNGSSNATQAFWRQSIDIVKGEYYNLEFNIASEGINPAYLQLYVDGEVAGQKTSAISSKYWRKVSINFLATSSGSKLFELKDLTTTVEGNDFLIDQISITMQRKTGITVDLSKGLTYKNSYSISAETYEYNYIDTLINIESVVGTAFNDTIIGNEYDNMINTGEGNDRISAGGGNDLISGGKGTDNINAGDGGDLISQDIEKNSEIINGGEGVDTIDYSLTTFDSVRVDSPYFGVFADLKLGTVNKYPTLAEGYIDAISNIENIIGTELIDHLLGDKNSNLLSGNGGDDLIKGDDGDDILVGGDGSDTLFGENAKDAISGGFGSDYVIGGNDDDIIIQDIEKMIDELDGGDGVDLLDYSSTILTREAIFKQDFEKDSVKWNTEYIFTNTLQPITGASAITNRTPSGWGFSTNTGIKDSSDLFLMVDGSTNSKLSFWSQKVKLVKGESYKLSLNVNSVGTSNAQFQLSIESTVISTTVSAGGSSGWIKIFFEFVATESGEQIISLRDMNIDANFNDFAIDNIELFATRVNGLDINLSSGITRKFGSDSTGIDKLKNIESVTGSNYSDQIIGDANTNMLNGNDGNDVIRGEDGNDVLTGGLGTDNIFGGKGEDLILQDITWSYESIEGGEGIDTVDYSVTEILDVRADIGYMGIYADLTNNKIEKYHGLFDGVFDSVYGVENIVGTVLNDTLIGDIQNNMLVGGEGDDSLDGKSGDDLLIAGANNDIVKGDMGSDVIATGTGVDFAYGGDGDDMFLQDLEGVNDFFDGGDGKDTINYSGNIFFTDSIIKQDFEYGTADWFTEYKHSSKLNDVNIQSVIVNIAPDWGFTTLTGVSGSTDKFLLIDGDSDITKLLPNTFWGQYVPLTKGESYRLTMDVNSSGGTAANFQLYLDEIATGFSISAGSANGWKKLSIDFIASRTGSIKVSLKDLEKSASWNDFGIDNIEISSIRAKGVTVDLNNGKGYKFGADSLVGIDTLRNIENASGTDLSDILVGDSNNNVLDGLSGNDTISGGQGSDALSGGIGDDTLSGSTGNDLLSGGKGADTIYGEDGNDLILQDLDFGNDTIDGGAGLDTIDYSEKIAISNNKIGISANLSTNKIEKYYGNEITTLLTDQSVDLSITEFLSLNATFISGQFEIENIEIDSIRYNIYSSILNIDGIDGSKVINVDQSVRGQLKFWAAVFDGISTKAVEVLFKETTGGILVSGLKAKYAEGDQTSGNFDFNSQGNSAQLVTAHGNVGNGVSRLSFKASNKFIKSQDSVTNIENVVGTQFKDLLIGNANNNTLSGLDGNDVIYGRGGDDILDGGLGNNTIYGEQGNDTIYGGIGYTNYYDGGEGIDTVDYSKNAAKIGVNLVKDTGWGFYVSGGGAYTYFQGGVDWGRRDDFIGIENIIGSNFDDTINGNDGINTLFGGNGNDTISGAAGNDLLDGGAGNNLIYGGTGDDIFIGSGYQNTFDGGAGNDTVDYSKNSNSLNINMNYDPYWGTYSSGGAAFTAYNGRDTDWSRHDDFVSIENVIGSSNADSIIGNDAANNLDGRAGNDSISGMAGDDTYHLTRTSDADQLTDFNTTAGNSDSLCVGANITTSQLWFEKIGADLKVSVTGTANSATIKDWYVGASNQIEKIKTTDGKTLLNTDVQKLVQAMASFSPPAIGQTSLPTSYLSSLSSVIAANWQ